MIKGIQFREHPGLINQTLSRFFQTASSNGVQITSVLRDVKKTDITPSNQPKLNPGATENILGTMKGIPTAIDKRFLVWSGSYKSVNEVPNKLDANVIHRARSWGRIRVNITFLLLTAAGGGLMAYLGKQGAAKGESLEQQNLEWHRKIKEDYESEQRRKGK